MRLLTFNIAHGRGLGLYHGWQSESALRRNLDRIAALLSEADADVVALQEVDVESHWNHRLNLLEYLREAGGYPYAELAATNRRSGMKPLLYGNGMLSRWPIGHWEALRFDQKTIWGKGLLWAEIAMPGGVRLPVLNLHLDFASRRKRVAQVEEVIELLHRKAQGWQEVQGHDGAPNVASADGDTANRAATPLLDPIICGDFNARDANSRDAVRHLRHHLPGDAGYRIEPRRARTFPSVMPTRGIDFVFVPACVDLVDTQVLTTYTSDHRPVLVELTGAHLP
ncbi:MAG: endonuclease/exonuclease/phosphatase family protein [Opitutales bacterium]